jgi:hypothetical protein
VVTKATEESPRHAGEEDDPMPRLAPDEFELILALCRRVVINESTSADDTRKFLVAQPLTLMRLMKSRWNSCAGKFSLL